MQERTDTSVGNVSIIKSGCYNLINYTKNNSNKNVVPIYNSTWVVKSSSQGTQNVANSNFNSIRNSYGGKVVYSGNAFISCSNKHPGISLYTDDRHPTVAGQYLNACCIYAAIFGESPVGIKASDVNATTAKQLQQIAAKAMGF